MIDSVIEPERSHNCRECYSARVKPKYGIESRDLSGVKVNERAKLKERNHQYREFQKSGVESVDQRVLRSMSGVKIPEGIKRVERNHVE
jgi:hypothetical protein